MKCERCQQETVSWMMSWFNTQKLCQECRTKERAHPLFKEAQKAVHDQESQGNRNYEGIGLPKDLEEEELCK